MIQKLEIEGYRCFEKLTVEGLGRLNLIVGQNNSGKTSLLEAIHLVTSFKPDSDLKDSCIRRGEDNADTPGALNTFMLANLFWGRLSLKKEFLIRAFGKVGEDQTLKASIVESASQQSASPINFEIASSKFREKLEFPVGGNGSVMIDTKASFAAMVAKLSFDKSTNGTLFLSSNGLSIKNIRALWESLSIDGLEVEVLKVMKDFDSEINDFRFFDTIGNDKGHVKLEGVNRWVPLGTLGDGAVRVLALAAAATRGKGGVLLVDEIDTALHYTTLSKVWKMLYRFAVESDTQIFATTHSQDCVEAFASLVRDGIATSQELSLQRVVKGESKTISYSGDILLAAVKHEFEVR